MDTIELVPVNFGKITMQIYKFQLNHLLHKLQAEIQTWTVIAVQSPATSQHPFCSKQGNNMIMS